jgi:hypothetical protein
MKTLCIVKRMDHAPDDHAEPTTPDAGSAGMPRWVKVSLAVAAVLLVLAVALMLFGGGEHGPGRHLGGAAPTSSTLDQPSRISEPAR